MNSNKISVKKTSSKIAYGTDDNGSWLRCLDIQIRSN